MSSHDSTRMYSSTLAVTDNSWLEQITTDIPFLAVGIVALACVTCLLLTQRLSIPAACILTSAFFAFNGAIFDFARLLQVSKNVTNTNIANSGPFAIVILREISFALSISLNYLFFLIYLGRPPRGEVMLVDPAERGRARRESPSRWAYWGWFGYLLQALLAGAIVAVAVLEVLWRVTEKPKGPVYMADGIVEGVIALSFLGKIILNTWFSPLTPRWKTLRDYSPIIFALSVRLGIIITEEFCEAFSEAPLGRLLQAIQLYVLLVLVLVSPYWELREKDEEYEQPEPKRASSFRGLRFSTVSQLSALNTAPEIYAQGTQNFRGSPSQRLSSWINSRLATRKDPSQDRLWIKDNQDLEALPTPRDQNVDENDGSPMNPRFVDQQPTATWQGPYVPNPTTPEATSNPTTPNTPGQIINITANIAPVPNLSAPKVPGQRNSTDSKPSGRFIGKFEISENYESDSDSPIYGINGIIQKKAQRSEKKRRSKYDPNRLSAIEQLKKEQEELEKSVASMSAFSPSKSDFGRKSTSNEDGDSRPDFTSAAIPSYLTGGGLSESVKSDFSLRDFPSPPASVFTSAKPNDRTSPIPLPERSSKVSTTKDTGGDGLETVDDVQFAMVPPRMPAAYSYSRRRASFPAVARESATSSVDGYPRIISAYADSEDDIGRRVRISDANNNRLDVTSFIGELTTPQPSKGFGQGRTDSRARIDSTAFRLSPLPESDNSPRPSVEIIDMRIKSPMFTPAIAITTGEKTPVTAQRNPKVSFAPVTYDPTGRPKINKSNPVLLNTLPASPRPSASPTESPKGASQFKPATSSPLAGGTDSSSSRRGVEKSGTTVPDFSNGSRPFISGPMPLRPAETDYQASRRAPNPARTQRFL